MTYIPSAKDMDGPFLLIVDDDHSIRELLSRSLSAQGYRVHTVGDVPQMEDILGSRLNQSQKATAAARLTADRKFRASLS